MTHPGALRPPPGGETPLCEAERLAEGGRGLRFRLWRNGVWLPAFAIRYQGTVRAYLNRCSHRGVELDWEPGEFFSAQGDALICATHGARYDPASGACLGGPCSGGLTGVPIRERDGRVWLDLAPGERLARHDE